MVVAVKLRCSQLGVALLVYYLLLNSETLVLTSTNMAASKKRKYSRGRVKIKVIQEKVHKMVNLYLRDTYELQM